MQIVNVHVQNAVLYIYKMDLVHIKNAVLYIYKMQFCTETKCSFVHIQNAVMYIYKMQFYMYKMEKIYKYFD